MAQGQRSGIEGVTMTLSIPDSDLAPYKKPDFLTIQGHESRSSLYQRLPLLEYILDLQ
jgi:hypothetical protein